MINSTEILEQLRNGKSIETIGKEIGAVLTLAQNQYEEEIAKELEEEQKLQQMEDICYDLISWLEAYYPSMSQNVSEAELHEIAKSMVATFDEVSSYGDTIFHVLTSIKQPKVEKIKIDPRNWSGIDWKDLINSFIDN